jgi:hypothetical protein
VAAQAAPPGPLGDQRPLVFGDGAADLERELVVRVAGHRAVEELDAAALGLQLLEQEGLVDEVASQPVGSVRRITSKAAMAAASRRRSRPGRRSVAPL